MAKAKEIRMNRSMHPLIVKRWSPRSFTDEKISKEDLETIFLAASWAPSSMNEQPWRYLYAHRDDENFNKFVACLNPTNQEWAKNAAVLIISMAEKYIARNGKPNRHYMHDTGSANISLILQALHLGIHGHMMGGFDMEKTIETFSIPESLEPVCFIALGYLDSPEKLSESLRIREMAQRKRKPLPELVFKNKLP